MPVFSWYMVFTDDTTALLLAFVHVCLWMNISVCFLFCLYCWSHAYALSLIFMYRLWNAYVAEKRSVCRSNKPPPAKGLLELRNSRRQQSRRRHNSMEDKDYQPDADENSDDESFKGMAAWLHFPLIYYLLALHQILYCDHWQHVIAESCILLSDTLKGGVG